MQHGSGREVADQAIAFAPARCRSLPLVDERLRVFQAVSFRSRKIAQRCDPVLHLLTQHARGVAAIREVSQCVGGPLGLIADPNADLEVLVEVPAQVDVARGEALVGEQGLVALERGAELSSGVLDGGPLVER